MKIGALNRKVTIQHLVDGQDEIGQPVTTWATLATVYADIRHLSGLESIKADAQTATVKASIRIRRRSDVTAAMRVAHGATTYEINAVLPDEQRRDHLDLSCEVVS
jgi:SPP1 family predicted phage head-tail adaptor